MMLTDLPRYMVGGYVDYCNRYNCVKYRRVWSEGPATFITVEETHGPRR